MYKVKTKRNSTVQGNWNVTG